ncbi:MAG TPA: sigma-54 dependent transcriptional regulator [Candidatus Hydrogenedentes bacterium]|nr:sigma-54 dependent transcriptional regulator [Candidatus Hydrogenedentota bacterium]HOL75950.1 sigma-54 dependent transcriptional regulator [Candidatus Hydrogenedentota bacterium]HPO85641.1 sigma-54 dependent transcriptional regulator [Candidatus Hydrogenedentota bacterium]
MNRILIIDDEKLIRWSIQERLTREGYVVDEAEDGKTAIFSLKKSSYDLVLLDMRLPDISGMELLHQFRDMYPDMPVIVITAYSSINNAVEAMKEGARDYISKPFDMDMLAFTVRRVLSATGLERRLRTEVQAQKRRFGLTNLVGVSDAMARIRDMVRRVAASESTTVLLLGESGVGKDMVARAIHYESDRVDMPFMNVTCTALPETLLDSELFGYEKGAFTDAREQKKGLFEIANGGTVFLDEIGDMSPALQAKLLRVLEDKAFKRIGGTTDITVDVRIIAATNRDLEHAIEQKSFREDLYYRLSILPIVIPPLRERMEDVPVLAEHFLQEFNREFHRQPKKFSPDALKKLCNYGWPGNVRELRNVIERAMLLGTGNVILPDDILLGRHVISPRGRGSDYNVRLPVQGCVLWQIERDLIRQALERTGGVQTQAAKLVGLTRDQIRYKMEKYGIGPDGSLVGDGGEVNALGDPEELTS